MNLIVVYYSMTNQTEEFIKKVKPKCPDIRFARLQIGQNGIPEDEFLLITPTYNQGQIPMPVKRFLEPEETHEKLLGVVSSGNKNWGKMFANAGNIISEQYDVPLLHKYELRGNEMDVDTVVDIIHTLATLKGE